MVWKIESRLNCKWNQKQKQKKKKCVFLQKMYDINFEAILKTVSNALFENA